MGKKSKFILFKAMVFLLLMIQSKAFAQDLEVTDGQSLSGVFDNLTIKSGGIGTLNGDLVVNQSLVVETDGVLDVGAFAISGSATFTVKSNATVVFKSSLATAIGVSGAKNWGNDANIVLNGSELQELVGFPKIVSSLVLDNPGGAKLGADLEVANLVKVDQGKLDLQGKQLLVRAFNSQKLVFENNSAADHNFTLRFQRPDQVFEVTGSEMLNLGNVDSQSDRCKVLMNQRVNLKNDGRFEKGSHFQLNGSDLVLRPDFDGFGSYGAPYYFQAGQEGAIVQKINKTARVYEYHLITPNMASSASTLGNRIKVKVNFTASTVAPDAFFRLKLVEGVHPNAVGKVTMDYLKKYIQIEFTNTTNPMVDIEFSYMDDDIVGSDDVYGVSFYDDEGWNPLSGSVSAAGNVVMAQGIDRDGVVGVGRFLGLDLLPCPVPMDMKATDITFAGATLTWNVWQPAYIANYQLQYRPFGSDEWGSVTDLPVGQYQLTGLTQNTVYEWRVASACNHEDCDETSEFSEMATFTTQEDNGCMAPVGVQVVTLSSGSATVIWQPVAGALGYQVDYKKSGEVAWTTVDVDAGGSEVILPLEDEQFFNVRIRTTCESNQSLAYSQEISFLSFIEGYDALTNNLYVSSERVVPTIITFNNVIVQHGGKAILSQDLTVLDKVEVESGGVLYCGSYSIVGDVFTLHEGAHLGIGSAKGITKTTNEGNIRTVVRNFAERATYEYNGTVDQVTGDALGSNYDRLIVNSGRKLDLGRRPYLGKYVQVEAGYLVSDLNCYFNKNTVIENNAGPDILAQCLNTQTNADDIVITLKGKYPTRVHWHVDKRAVFHIYSDIVVDNFSSYQSSRGVVYLYGANLVLKPATTIGVNQVFFDVNSRFVQLADASLVNTQRVYDRFYDADGNPFKFQFKLTALEGGSDAAFVFQSTPRSHPERGGALNFLKTYLDLNTQGVQSFSADLSLDYQPSQVIGDEGLLKAGYYAAGKWNYEGAIFNQGAKQVLVNNITSAGQLSAGFDFSLTAQTCAVPQGLSSSNVDYQGARLMWQPVADGVDLYRVVYRKKDGGDWELKEVSGGETVLLSGLDFDSEYEWAVQTLCLPGFFAESDLSAIASFRTEPLKECGIPVGLSSDDITSSTAVLKWNGVEGAVGYTLQYRLEGASAWSVVSIDKGAWYEVNSLDALAKYQWRVSTGCGAGYHPNSGFAETPVDFTTTPPCEMATALAASDIFYYGATLKWQPGVDAASQTIRYAKEGSIDWSTITDLVGEANEYATGEVLLPEQPYQWQVRNYCANGGVSPFTASSVFSTTQEPVCAVAVDFAVNPNTTTAQLSWASGNSTALEQLWVVELRKQGEETFTSRQVVGTSLDLEGLEEGTAYEWRVRTICDGYGYPWADSGWSAIQTFTTWMTCDQVPVALSSNVEGWCSAQLKWEALPGITKYELRYRIKGETDWIEKVLGNRNENFFTAGLPATTYEWQVRTFCFGTETNSSWSEVAEFTTLDEDGMPCGAPTDNPYLTKYGFAPQWTNDLPWDTFVNLTDYEDGSGYWDEALVNAMADVYMKGGGVVYCPAGEYSFRDNVEVFPNVIIRGETPAVTDAKSANFAPPARFVFPKFEPIFEGAGGDNASAFKRISSGGTRSNTGLVYLDVNRAAIKFNVDLIEMDGFSTVQPAGEKKNVLLFGLRSNNVAAPDANVPGVGQHAWQRWGNRFAVNISAFVTENGIIANNRVNDLGENNLHPIADDSFQMPGYLVADGTNILELGENQAWFDYTKHYGIELNRGKAFKTFGTREAEPSLYARGNEVIDNWLFTTGRVGIMASGDGLVIRGNVKKDRAGKVAWVDPTGRKLVGNSATMENRGIDMSGENVTVADNYLEVYNDLLKDGAYLSVDGEGILIQECCGGSPVKNFTIENNVVKGSNGYIGIYKMRDIDGLVIRNNDLSGAQGMQSNHSIWVDADTNGAPYRADNVRIEGNKTNKTVALRAAVGACNTYIVNNTGSGNIVAPCNTVVANNQGLTYGGTPCAPEVGCDMGELPEIASFDPSVGAEMYVVTLQGLALEGTEKILIGAVEVTNYKVINGNTIEFTIPVGAKTDKITIHTNKAHWNGNGYTYPAVAVSAQDLVIGESVAPIVLTPIPGYYDGAVTVTISSASNDAVIYYTLDGQEPDETALAYTSGGVQINETSELRARGYKAGLLPSLEVSGLYMLQIIDADFSYAGNMLGHSVEFTCSVVLPFGEVAKVEWDFDGDGVYEKAGMVVGHAFMASGAHTVRMKVITDLGFTRVVEKEVVVVATGIQTLERHYQINLWPNPATEVVNVSFEGLATSSRVKYFITDMLGRLMFFNEASVATGESLMIRLSSLKPGTYLVTFHIDGHKEVRQLIVK